MQELRTKATSVLLQKLSQTPVSNSPFTYTTEPDFTRNPVYATSAFKLTIFLPTEMNISHGPLVHSSLSNLLAFFAQISQEWTVVLISYPIALPKQEGTVKAVRIPRFLTCSGLMYLERDRLRNLRETLAQRRRTLNAARLLPPQSQTLSKESQELTMLSQTIARARSGLVQELVEVFHVVEVGGRPAVGGRPGARGEWTIGGLVLPVPGDVRRTSEVLTTLIITLDMMIGYPPDHINAVITHTIHFLGLLTFYLGIKLPFEVSWSCRRFGAGMPWIGAGRGSESWAK